MAGDLEHGFTVSGTLAGPQRVLDRACREHGLTPVPPGSDTPPLRAPGGCETLTGAVRPSRAAKLVGSIEPSERLRLTGNGDFEILGGPDRARSDRLLAVVAELEGVAEISCGGPDRRGRSTPGDPTAERLEHTLRSRLDPHEVLR